MVDAFVTGSLYFQHKFLTLNPWTLQSGNFFVPTTPKPIALLLVCMRMGVTNYHTEINNISL